MMSSNRIQYVFSTYSPRIHHVFNTYSVRIQYVFTSKEEGWKGVIIGEKGFIYLNDYRFRRRVWSRMMNIPV